MNAPTGGLLRIEQLRCEYLLPEGYPDPPGMQRRLDEAAQTYLPRLLRAWLGQPQFASDESVWLIRRLDLDLSVRLDGGEESAARHWGAVLAQSVVRTIAAGSDGFDVLYFPNRAAYLANFLSDLASGAAWGRWYYRKFDGLRLLKTASALRTALLDDPAAGLAALGSLSAGNLLCVAEALGPREALRVLQGLPGGNGASLEANLEAILETWEQRPLAAEVQPLAGEALVRFVRVLGGGTSAGGHGLQHLTLALSALRRRLASGSAASAGRLKRLLLGGDLAQLTLEAGTETGKLLAPLVSLGREPMEAVLKVLSPAAEPKQPAPTDTLYTPFGGAFLLLPLLSDLPLAELTAGWPQASLPPSIGGQVESANLLRFLLLCRCMGRSRTKLACEDALLRHLCGVHPRLTSAALRRWCYQLTAEQIETLRLGLLDWEWERTFAPSGTDDFPVYLLAAAPRRGGPIPVLLEWPGLAWLDIGPRAGTVETGWASWLEQRLPELPPFASREELADPGAADGFRMRLVVDLRLGLALDRLRSSFAGVEVVGLEAIHPDERVPGVPVPAQVEQVRVDWEYLISPQVLRWDRAARLDGVLKCIAQRLLRRFAGRLPGFAASSLPYLYTNFLDFPASFEETGERRVARLGRPPLALLLNVTGMRRGELRLDWSEGPPLELFEEG